jgi:hypothetical protein
LTTRVRTTRAASSARLRTRTWLGLLESPNQALGSRPVSERMVAIMPP